MATVAELLVKISGDSKGLQKEIAASQRQLKRAYGPEALAASEKLATGLGVLSAAASAVAAVGGKMAVGWNLAVNSLEDVTGMSGEAGSKLLSLAEMVGLTGEDMSAALVKMSKNAQTAFESIQENGAASTDAFTRFGVAIMDSNGVMLSAEQIYANVAAKHREMANGVEKTAMEVAIFGKSGAKLNDLLNLTTEQMDTMTAKAQRMGLVIGSEQSQAWETATFEVNRAKLGFTAAGNAIMTDLLPAVSSATSRVADMLEAFAVDTKMYGVTTALRNLIPDSLEPAIMGVSVALTSYAIPALTMTGYRAMAALGPLGWFGIALGVIAGLAVDTGNALAKMGDQADDAVARMNGFNAVGTDFASVGVKAQNTWGAVAGGLSQLDDTLGYTVTDLAHYTKASKSAADASGVMATGTGSKGAAKAFDELAKKTEQASKSIEREWVQLTKTQIEQLDKWFSDETKALDESKVANENYERDVLRLKETYDARKKKIDENEYARIVNLKRAAQDITTSNQNRAAGIGLTGVDKQALDLQTGMDAEIQGVTRKYEDMVNEFATLDAAAKANNIKAWQEAGLAFKINEDGTVDFTAQAEAEKFTIRKDYADRYKQLEYDRVKFQQDLEKAYHDGDIQRFTELLATKQALEAQDLAGRQAMISSYYQIWQDTHRSAMSYMAEAMTTFYNGATNALTDIFTGAKSASEAFQDLGKSILKMLAQWVAQQIAGGLALALFGKGAMAAQVAAATVAGAATAAAWAPAAAMVSLATMGGNSAPAMAGIGATVGFSMGLAIPAMATGGITTGPTLAMIGEGRYQEAVLPLNKRMFEKMGLTGGGRNVTATVTQNIHGGIHTKIDMDEAMEELGAMVHTTAMGVV